MEYSKYDRQILTDAAADSTSVAGVLRHLGIRANGGSHAHIARQLRRLEIDTSHFTGRPRQRAVPRSIARRPEDVLVKREAHAQRTPGFRLRRAMLSLGVADRCANCGIGAVWNDEPLTLHVDHISGDFLNNRIDNLQLLCPNCHSQTATYAGRNRQVLGRQLPLPETRGDSSDDDAIIDVVARFNSGELNTAQAAEAIGCDPKHLFLVRKRLIEDGALNARVRDRIRSAQRAAVVDHALSYPNDGYRAISAALRSRVIAPMIVGDFRIRAILVDAGLNTREARRAAAYARRGSRGLARLDGPAGVAER